MSITLLVFNVLANSRTALLPIFSRSRFNVVIVYKEKNLSTPEFCFIMWQITWLFRSAKKILSWKILRGQSNTFSSLYIYDRHNLLFETYDENICPSLLDSDDKYR